MNIIISKKIEIENILQSNPPQFSGYKKDKLFYIISKLYMGVLCKEEYGITENDGVPLCAFYLDSVLGKAYKLHLKYLLDNKIIISMSGYVVGESCRTYKICDKYFDIPEWYRIKDFTFSRRLKKLNNRVKNKNQYPYLQKWFKHLNLDIEQANITTNLTYELKIACPEYQDVAIGTNHPKNPKMQYYHSKMVIEYFQKAEYPFYVDEKGNRAHTIITRSNKNIRNFITCNGENLVSIDLKNSQPYLLLCLTNPQLFQKKQGKKRKQNQQPQPTIHTIPISDIIPHYISSIILGLSSETLCSIEFQRYQKLVSSGRIYEFFEDKLTINNNELKNGKTKRDIVKYRMMLCLYSKNGGYSGGMKSVFKKHFPKLYTLICKLKANKHNTLAILLQRIESYLILEVICNRIAFEKPQLPIFTIHDCIVTTVGNEQYVSKIIKEEMQKIVGIAPMLSFERWNPKMVWNKFEQIDLEFSKSVA